PAPVQRAFDERDGLLGMRRVTGVDERGRVPVVVQQHAVGRQPPALEHSQRRRQLDRGGALHAASFGITTMSPTAASTTSPCWLIASPFIFTRSPPSDSFHCTSTTVQRSSSVSPARTAFAKRMLNSSPSGCARCEKCVAVRAISSDAVCGPDAI